MSKALEEGRDLSLDFDKLKKVALADAAVVPVAVQDVDSKDVLIIAYANEEALTYTLEHGVAAFWSTSRNDPTIRPPRPAPTSRSTTWPCRACSSARSSRT